MSGFTVNIHSKASSVGQQTPAAKLRATTVPNISSKSAKDAFLAAYEPIQQALLNDLDTNTEMDEHRRKYLKRMMDTTVLGGKYNRGICVVDVTIACLKNNNNNGGSNSSASAASSICDDDIVFASCVLGWCIEFLQAHFLIEDDIMDGSLTRRGNACWYKHPGVSTAVAINDGLIVMAWCTRMLELLLWWHPNRNSFFSILHKTDFYTTIGQMYDTTSVYDSAKLNPDVACPTTTDFKEFTLHTYNRIVKYKTAFYTYHCPMLFGLSVTMQEATVDAALVESIALIMGEYFQVQDDFLDCFGDPAQTGKIGTDIEDNKCSWLACTFLATQAADAKRIAGFKANYGQHDAAKVALIKGLYKEANLVGKFEEYEANIVKTVDAQLKALEEQNKNFSDAIALLWGRTYKRTM